MDALRPETLHRLERNDNSVTLLKLGHAHNSIGPDHFSRLGKAIAKSSLLTFLEVDVYRCNELTESNIDFFEGIKQNSSIQRLRITCGGRNIIGTAVHEILKAYHENNNVLAQLHIDHAGLQNGGHLAVAETLRCCTNLNYIKLSCDINDEHMLPLVEALRRRLVLYRDRGLELDLSSNRIGNAGCNAIATLLEDTNRNLKYLSLSNNQIGDNGAITLANSLASNTKLKTLDLHQNTFNNQSYVSDTYERLLCDTSSISATYSSNHTLRTLTFSFRSTSECIYLLRLNRSDANISNVAIKKILLYHPNIDMEPLFELDEKGERSLKGLPLIIDWFERAKEAVTDGRDEERIQQQKFSAIYQFALVMPELFIPTEYMKYIQRKRRKTKES